MKVNADMFPSLARLPEVSEVTTHDVSLMVPRQFYGLADLKGLRKLIKQVEKQIKANAANVEEI
jgi:hypothetical protein